MMLFLGNFTKDAVGQNIKKCNLERQHCLSLWLISEVFGDMRTVLWS